MADDYVNFVRPLASLLTETALYDVWDNTVGPPLPGEHLGLGGPWSPHLGVGDDIELKVLATPKSSFCLFLQRSTWGER